ncbi:minor head protein inhibitor of protease [Escherichia phage EcS1]|uniref:Inhibitor of prohead protease n=1 Tax=Escherichia phage EcS1 TaxID=2083276 RepID=A0A2Z5ZC71_9CAUD|nr:minor head protein inhibitor of protease [Escherichia phage EcS1]BBC78248.1 Inhibitor of prohead protease [Escherichia phage EcS1]
MIDKIYIDELRELDKKEAKEKLADYALTFNITLKKTKSFDNMVADLSEEMKKLASEPMPEDIGGMSISDLIQADDELTGTSVFKDEAKDEAKTLLIDSIGAPSVEAKIINSIQAPIGEVVTVIHSEGIETIPTKPMTEEDLPALEKAIEQIIESEKVFELPKDFSPTLAQIGRGLTYVTLPWWIYEWITKNPEWKVNPHSFPHHYGIDTILSLLYYIKRDGLVRVRETRNSSFQVIK